MGEIPVETLPYLKIETIIDRQGITSSLSVTLVVRVDRTQLPPGKPWKRKDSWSQKAVLKSAALESDQVEFERKVVQTFVSAASQLAPSLFELDPRIGVTLKGKILPCPLFDPTEPNRNPATLPLKIRRALAWAQKNQLSPSAFPGKLWAADCVFCANSVTQGCDPGSVVWGGGNIGWIHVACGSWITPQP